MVSADLLGHQVENIAWLSRVGRGMLADEPGLGKSRSALEAFAGADRVLIVAPSLVLESGTWDDEVEAWGSDDTRYFAASYSMLNRRNKTGNGSGTRPVKALRPEWKGHWDAVIIDEAHYIKGRDTSWTWAVDQIAKNSDQLALMTGTPIPNWAHEVFTLLRTIYPQEAHPGKRYGSFHRWADEWFDTKPNPYATGTRPSVLYGDLRQCLPACKRRDPNDPCDHYVEFAKVNFGERYMRHLRADCLDLPPLVFGETATPFDSQTRWQYRQLKRDFATSINGSDVLAWSQGAKNVLMDKMTTSPWLLHKEGEPCGGKFDRLRADLRGRTRPTVVFAHYRDSVEACARVAESIGARAGFIHGGTTDKQNAKSVKAFKAGRLDVLVGSLETMAEGLTLTVADTAIMVETSYKPSRNTQAMYRIHRMGQKKECRIVRYVTPQSVDSGKQELLKAKTDHQMRVLTAAELLNVA